MAGRRLLGSAFLAAALGLSAAAIQPAWGQTPAPATHGHAAGAPLPNLRGIQVIAHRGGETATPESTLPAFANAIAAGADGIVFDIRLTRDHVPVVLHDDTLNRTTNCSGPVENLTAARLRHCNAAARFPRFGFTRIPTFDETLKFIGARSRTVVLQLHAKKVRDAADATAIMNVVRQNGLLDDPRVSMLADNDTFLHRLGAAGARRLGLVFHDYDKAQALNGPWKVLYAWDAHLTRADVAAAAAHGQLLTASQDHPQSLEELLALGVPSISADDIDHTLDRLGRGPVPSSGSVTFSAN